MGVAGTVGSAVVFTFRAGVGLEVDVGSSIRVDLMSEAALVASVHCVGLPIANLGL